jgi:uncharacterized protein YqeY
MTTLKQQIESDLLESIRSKDEVGKNTLRMLLSAMKLYEIDKSSKIDDSGVLNLIQKEIKTRRESIVDFEKGKRQDLVDSSQLEVAFLEKYLPKQLSDSEIEEIVNQAINEVNAVTMSDMGKVMKVVLPRTSGLASSDRVSLKVRELLGKISGS